MLVHMRRHPRRVAARRGSKSRFEHLHVPLEPLHSRHELVDLFLHRLHGRRIRRSCCSLGGISTSLIAIRRRSTRFEVHRILYPSVNLRQRARTARVALSAPPPILRRRSGACVSHHSGGGISRLGESSVQTCV